MQTGNIFHNPPDASRREVVEEFLAFGDGIRLERIFSHCQASPDGFWYDQDCDEWVMILSGGAELSLGDERTQLRIGDWVHIPAHTRHRVESTLPDTVWLALHNGK